MIYLKYAVINICFGIALEVIFTAFSKLFDGRITPEDRQLKGDISLWMIPVYGLLLTGVGYPLMTYMNLYHLPFYIEYFIYAVGFIGFEFLSGLFYDKVFNIKPWEYTGKFSIMGYIKLTYLPMWGLAGLIWELYFKWMVS